MAIDLDHALEFFDFVVERHAMYERRQAGLPQEEWTTNTTLATRKFTNVFRWLDPGSQFVLTDLLTGIADVDLYRCTLYRYTNWPDTWRRLRDSLGEYPMPYHNQGKILSELFSQRDAGHQMFSGAYMIIPQPGKPGDKLKMVVELAVKVTRDTDKFIDAQSQADRHRVLTGHYGVGDFLGLQILTDFMYQWGVWETEDEFVVPGPGSNRGTRLFAPGYNADSVIRWAHKALLRDPRCPILSGRQPSVMDVQNCFCEYSKYVKGPQSRIYRPAHPGPLPEPVLPTAYRR